VRGGGGRDAAERPRSGDRPAGLRIEGRDIRLIVSDLDRTLLNSKSDFSEKTLRTIAHCRAKGLLFAFATARSERSAKRLIDAVKPDFVISDSGALLKGNGQTLYRRALTAATADGLLRDLKASGVVSCLTADTEDGYFANHPPSQYPDYAHGIFTDFSGPLGRECYKISVEYRDLGPVVRIAERYPECAWMGYVDESWLKIGPREATKWLAVEALLSHLALEPRHYAAFGDDLSDLEMIERAGVGVAMANAIPAVRAKAAFVAGNHDQDGVARFLEAYFR